MTRHRPGLSVVPVACILLFAGSCKRLGNHHIGRAHVMVQSNNLLSSTSRFEVLGCCVDEIGEVDWSPKGLRFQMKAPADKLERTVLDGFIENGQQKIATHQLAAFSVTTRSSWSVDPKSGRPRCNDHILPVVAHSETIQGLVVEDQGNAAFFTVETVLNGKHEGGLLLYRSTKPEEVVTIDMGNALHHPTGVALSADGKQMYVVDEQPSQVSWEEFDYDCGDKWTHKGPLARFPLTPGDRASIFRSIVVTNGMAIGSAPGGLYFFGRDGQEYGYIQTPAEVGYIMPSGNANRLVVTVGDSLASIELKETVVTSASDPTRPCPNQPSPPCTDTIRAPNCCCSGAATMHCRRVRCRIRCTCALCTPLPESTDSRSQPSLH